MLNLIKSMLIILSLMLLCIVPSVACTMLVGYFLDVSDTFKGGVSVGVWGFSMLWVGGMVLNAMAMEGATNEPQ